ncbi:hypothetical protein F511_43311 [Dorcoceras hygrometricum]|uniref:Uncharacterized protein n=1 Tax=Dorcoceras hygrometricum TaxID=472368 RepID=A0A2Z7B3V5_9LAMI|nr:hypothetical protein F511_43311 [Dorcoceras hygrometricum]
METLDWMSCSLRLVAQLRYFCFSCVWDSMSTGYAKAMKLATGSIELATGSCDCSLQLDFLLYDVASLLRLDIQAICWYLATAGLKPSAEYDDVTNDVINAKPSADSSARRRFISFTSFHLLIASC